MRFYTICHSISSFRHIKKAVKRQSNRLGKILCEYGPNVSGNHAIILRHCCICPIGQHIFIYIFQGEISSVHTQKYVTTKFSHLLCPATKDNMQNTRTILWFAYFWNYCFGLLDIVISSIMYSCLLCTLRYYYEISHKFKAPWDNLQNTNTQLQLTYICSCGPLNIVDIESSHFFYVLVSALYFHESSHKCKALWDDLQNTWTIFLVCLLLELLPFEHWK